MTDATATPTTGRVCSYCGVEPTPGRYRVQPLFNNHGEYYLARRCPECDVIHDRVTSETPLRAHYKMRARQDPDPPEGWG